jgi:hypothetical protein
LTARELVFLTDSNESIRTSKPRMKLKRAAGGRVPINHKVLTLTTSSSIVVKKYIWRNEDGATDLVCSWKDVPMAAPVPAMTSVPAMREVECLRTGVVAINTRKMMCRAINKPRLVCEGKVNEVSSHFRKTQPHTILISSRIPPWTFTGAPASCQSLTERQIRSIVDGTADRKVASKSNVKSNCRHSW